MKVEYEKEDCGRCGGSGRYSFNSIDGSRCYGCGGSGKRLTKRGAAAKKFADELLNVRIENVGQRKAQYVTMGRKIIFTGTVWKPHGFFGLLVNGKEIDYNLGVGMPVRLLPTPEEGAKIMAYQDSLTKAGTVKKGASK